MVAYSWVDGLTGPDLPMLGIGVVDHYHGVGLGRALLRLMIEAARRLGVGTLRLGVFDHNSRAIHVYESVGFQVDRMMPPRVFDGITEICMVVRTANSAEGE